ncbi:MAG: outer membrane beta-barrel protein [Rickettsiales bacterium]
MINYKQLIATTLLSSVALSSAFAQDSKDFFVQLNVGGVNSLSSTATSQYDPSSKTTGSAGTTSTIGIEAGTQINQYFSTNLSFDYLPNFCNSRDYKFDNVKVGSLTIEGESIVTMLNLSANIGSLGRFTPYVTAGIGYAKNTFKTRETVYSSNYYSSEDSTNNFAYKLGLGTKISLTESFDLDFRYQFMDLGKYKTGSYKIGQHNYGSYKGNLRTNELMAGIAYKF